MRSPFYGVPLNVSFFRALMALLIAILATLTSLSLVALLGAVKFIPFLAASALRYCQSLQRRAESRTRLLALSPLWLLAGCVLVPAGMLLGWAMLFLTCITYVGPVSGVESYFGRCGAVRLSSHLTPQTSHTRCHAPHTHKITP